MLGRDHRNGRRLYVMFHAGLQVTSQFGGGPQLALCRSGCEAQVLVEILMEIAGAPQVSRRHPS